MPLLRCVLTLIKVCLGEDQKLPAAVVEVAGSQFVPSSAHTSLRQKPHCHTAQPRKMSLLYFVSLLLSGSWCQAPDVPIHPFIYQPIFTAIQLPTHHLSIYPWIGQELQGRSHSFCYRKGKNFKPSHLEWSHHGGIEVL